jgi:hypothetical protein
MKNQYFGDVNDYIKYGLLRVLTGHGALSVAVCWMLTLDDERGDGGRVGYLDDPQAWREFDEELFDKLKELVPQSRRVQQAETANLLPNARYHYRVLSDNAGDRARYFEEFWESAQACDLVLFDPDNGFEVKSKPYGSKDSCKYLYWRELKHTFDRDHSLLVYQHFPREKRDVFIARMAQLITNVTQTRVVFSFRTSHAAFFLIPADDHRLELTRKTAAVAKRWRGKIAVEEWTP